MWKRGLPTSKFQPIDLLEVDSREELKAAIEYAGGRYRDFLDLQRADQLDWATRRKPFAKGAGDGELRAVIDRRLDPRKKQEYWTRYSIHGVTDTVMPKAPLLYTYMSKERLREHLDKKGLRVSAGAQRTELNQIGEFPRGPYGTTIPPYSEDVGQNAAARSFYGIEYSLDAVLRPSDPNPPRLAISTEYFVMFAQTTGFSPKGRLSFQKMQAGFAATFDHYALATPDLPVGSYLDYDIVAYGRNFMPKEIKGTLVARNNTGEQVAPVRNPATMQKIAVAGFNTVNTITVMRTGQ
nr:RolB/C-like protein [Vaccinium uliginosum]WGV39439.1 RolB/C-like protein [Vaccinium uliginosum]WGV39446.1 RolB/C-like protein [Vaccinium uliginosum]